MEKRTLLERACYRALNEGETVVQRFYDSTEARSDADPNMLFAVRTIEHLCSLLGYMLACENERAAAKREVESAKRMANE